MREPFRTEQLGFVLTVRRRWAAAELSILLYLANIKKRALATLCLFALLQTLCARMGAAIDQKPHKVASPNGRVVVTVFIGDGVSYSLNYDGRELIKPSTIALVLEGGHAPGSRSAVSKVGRQEVHNTLSPVFYKTSRLDDHYNELTLILESGLGLVFRAYDEGFAYRWQTSIPRQIVVRDEVFTCSFPEIPTATMLVGHFHQYESLYRRAPITALEQFEGGQAQNAALPLVLEFAHGPRIGIAQADLFDYPAMYLAHESSYPRALIGKFPAYPRRESPGGFMDYDLRIVETEDYIARTDGTRSFPWRAFILAERDAELLDSDLVYKLAGHPDPGLDYSWVKPGKVCWDFWTNWNLENLDFETGRNTRTFQYFIDFAARHHIEYVNLDWSWSDPHDLYRLNPDVDVPSLVQYAKSKGVGVLLWCLTRTLDRQMPEIMDLFQKWGVAGLKIDFFDRDDQKEVRLYEHFAIEAARRHMVVLFHGATPPGGFLRTYPNVLNFEAVRGMEYDKFDAAGTPPDHDVTLAFTRMLAGPMDYTPGAMRNANRADWKPISNLPMSQGTRCHQLAMYVVYEMPLSMLSDMPTAYELEPNILDYLAAIPTTWYETRALDGKLDEYAVIARRKGNRWYVGAMIDWNDRNIQVDLGFLSEGNYRATLFEDGINADKTPTDYREVHQVVNRNGRLALDLKSGGGAVAVLEKTE